MIILLYSVSKPTFGVFGFQDAFFIFFIFIYLFIYLFERRKKFPLARIYIPGKTDQQTVFLSVEAKTEASVLFL